MNDKALEILTQLVTGVAGLGGSDTGIFCIYCQWYHENFDAIPVHEENCPIKLGRELLGLVGNFPSVVCPECGKENFDNEFMSMADGKGFEDGVCTTCKEKLNWERWELRQKVKQDKAKA